MLNIVGLSAKMQCGKTTTTKMFIEEMDKVQEFLDGPKVESAIWWDEPAHYVWNTNQRDAARSMGLGKRKVNLRFKQASFGGVLKEEAATVANFPLEWCYGEEGKNQVVKLEGQANLDIPWPKPYMQVREILQWYGTDFKRAQNPDYWVNQVLKKISNSDHPNWVIDDVRFPNEADFILEQYGLLYRINPAENWVPNAYAEHPSETALDDYKHFSRQFSPKFGMLGAVAEAMAVEVTISFNNLRGTKVTYKKQEQEGEKANESKIILADS